MGGLGHGDTVMLLIVESLPFSVVNAIVQCPLVIHYTPRLNRGIYMCGTLSTNPSMHTIIIRTVKKVDMIMPI